MRTPFIAGNWKMFKTAAEAAAFAEEFKDLYKDTDIKTAICAPFVHLAELKKAFEGTGIGVGAQNAHYEDEGAFTGEISVKMLEDIGVDYCVIGHSERRQYFAETDETVNLKTKKALEKGLIPIVCVGESLEEREAGITMDLIAIQIKKAFANISAEDAKKVVIAYEPIWAIGTGKTATAEQAEEVCKGIRDIIGELYCPECAKEFTIQYGGSMNDQNAAELLAKPNIDGGLIGGASLIAEKFAPIVKACD